jgi:hypothetical protein
MSTTIIIRGNRITFRTRFFDVDGVASNPVSASLPIRYPQGKQYVAATPITLSQVGNIWSGNWESSVSDAGKVTWSVRSTSPAVAEDGFITLTANPANPEP